MNELCPYCNNKLTKGYIDGGKFFLRWHNEKMGFLEKHTIFGGEILSESNLVESYRCKTCNKIIIDLDQIKK